MLHDTGQEIQTALRGIEQQETLWIETNFVPRPPTGRPEALAPGEPLRSEPNAS